LGLSAWKKVQGEISWGQQEKVGEALFIIRKQNVNGVRSVATRGYLNSPRREKYAWNWGRHVWRERSQKQGQDKGLRGKEGGKIGRLETEKSDLIRNQ